mgnify:CR=1 FL=1
MKNPFLQMAVAAAVMLAAYKENALRDFYGKRFSASMFSAHSGHPGSKRPAHIVRSENRHRDKRAKLARRRNRS